MKKFTTIIAMLIICMCFVLCGCAPRLEMPTNYESVVSNGGFVVGAGNYMFFGNAYKSNTTLEEGDNEGEVGQYSLNRIELDRQTHPNSKWFKPVKNEENEYDFEKVAYKISAYQTSNLYVVGEYLYFTSPNVHKNNKNEHEYNLSTLFRIKLDGTGLKELYTAESSDAKFYLTSGQNQKLVIFDNKTIKTLNVSNKETRVKDLTKDIEVASVVFPKTSQDLAYLYFTVNRVNSGFTGNLLYKVSLQTGDTSSVSNLNGANETLTILAYENGILFYSKTGGSNNGIYSTDFASNPVKHFYTDDSNTISNLSYVKCEDDENNCFAFIYNNKLYIQLMSSTNNAQAIKLSDKTAKIQFVDNGYIYYSAEDGIYRISVKQKEEQQLSNLTNFNTEIMDFDGRFVYFFGQDENVTSGTDYLFRADTYIDEVRVECVANLLAEDIKED